MSIDLYYSFASAPSRSVMLTAAALNVKLNLIELNLMEKEHMTPEFLKINPQHTIPTIVDDGFSVWESRTIIRYLVNKYGSDSSLYPEDPKIRAVIDQRLDYDMGTLNQRYAAYIYPQFLDNAPPNEAAYKKILEALEFLNTFLEGNTYVASANLTIADFALVCSVSNMEANGVEISQYPNIMKWYELVRTTAPNYEEINQKGIEKTKKFMVEFMAKRAAQQ